MFWGCNNLKWRTKDEFNKVIVLPEDSLHNSLPKMNEAALQILLVVNKKGQLAGVVTDGDIRRGLLKGLDLKTPIGEIMYKSPRTIPLNTTINKAKKIMQQYGIRHIPMVNKEGIVKDLITWSDCFDKVKEEHREKVIIMAGGKGTRLDPFTKILPKPMIPLGDKPIIEVIMDKFYEQGFSEFVLSLGYKAEIVKMYFAETDSRPYHIDYVYESQPLGTAGSLSLLKDKINDTFIVINCDVILEPNFTDILEQHKKQENDITIVGSVKEFPIPYGVLKTEGQNLLMLDEKPNFHFLVNTGLYVLEPKVFDLIKDNEFIHMTDLIQMTKEQGGRVGVYPHHGNWFDVGQWEDYRNSLRFFSTVE